MPSPLCLSPMLLFPFVSRPADDGDAGKDKDTAEDQLAAACITSCVQQQHPHRGKGDQEQQNDSLKDPLCPFGKNLVVRPPDADL